MRRKLFGEQYRRIIVADRQRGRGLRSKRTGATRVTQRQIDCLVFFIYCVVADRDGELPYTRIAVVPGERA